MQAVKRVNSSKHMIVANGRIITEDITELKYNAITQKYEVTLKIKRHIHITQKIFIG